MQKTLKKHQKMRFFMFYSSKEIQAGPARVPHRYCGYLDMDLDSYPWYPYS
jgi:hypothetical protein